MKKSTKIITLLLSLILTFSVFALSAFASETDGNATENTNETTNNTANETEDNAAENTNEATNNTANETDGNATSSKIEIDFSFDRFVDSLQYMWKGMLCIFIVIGAIILTIYGLNKAMNSIEAKKKAKSEEEN